MYASGKSDFGENCKASAQTSFTVVSFSKNISKVLSSQANTMILATDGSVYVCGRATQNGDGSSTTNRTSPYLLNSTSYSSETVVDILMSERAGFLITSNSSHLFTTAVGIWGWGYNPASLRVMPWSSTSPILSPVKATWTGLDSSPKIFHPAGFQVYAVTRNRFHI